MIKQLFKYGIVTVASYFILIAGTFILVEFFNLPSSISYFFIISLVYFLVFIANTKYVFSVKPDKNTIIKFIASLVVFWAFNNIFFNIVVHTLGLHYLVAVVANIIFFGFVRFFIQKKFVFNSKP